MFNFSFFVPACNTQHSSEDLNWNLRWNEIEMEMSSCWNNNKCEVSRRWSCRCLIIGFHILMWLFLQHLNILLISHLTSPSHLHHFPSQNCLFLFDSKFNLSFMLPLLTKNLYLYLKLFINIEILRITWISKGGICEYYKYFNQLTPE